MERFNFQPLAESLIHKLQKEHGQFGQHYWYCNELEKNALLFVGINPSLKEDRKTPAIEHCSLAEALKNHPHYFDAFRKISDDLDRHPWTHLDLFLVRTKNQKKFEEILTNPHAREFLDEQLKLADKIIGQITPRAIIVCNALASKIFSGVNVKNCDVRLKYRLNYDPKLGTCLWSGTPVFFSGMLTGIRALDVESRKRLTWHIDYVLKQLET